MTYQISKVLSSLKTVRDRVYGDDAQTCFDLMLLNLPARPSAVYHHVNAYGGKSARDIAADLNMTHDHACGQLLYLYELGLVIRGKTDGVYVYHAVASWWQS